MNSVVLKRWKGLQDKNAAGEKPGQQNNRQRADADQIHLTDDLAGIARAAEEPGDDAPKQKAHLLQLVEKFCDWIHPAGRLNAARIGIGKGYNEPEKTPNIKTAGP